MAGGVGRPAGVAFVVALAAYLLATVLIERRRHTAAADMYEHEAEVLTAPHGATWRAALILLGGLAATLLGARFLVGGAISLAERVGMPEEVIGLTIVAIGTSMPELVTSVIAATTSESVETPRSAARTPKAALASTSRTSRTSTRSGCGRSPSPAR